MKTIVTGGAGFIGSHIQDKLLELGHQVVVIDNLITGHREYLNPQAEFIETSVQNKDSLIELFAKYQPEVVFHLAAQNNVPYSMEHPFEDQERNIVGMMNLMEAAKAGQTKKIVFSNTGGAFYGDVAAQDLPVTEDYPVTKPTSFYGVSKGSAESYLKLYGYLNGTAWVSLRYANVFGPRQIGSKEAGVISLFTAMLLKGEQPTINGDGSNTRDYVYISDVVEANMKAMNFGGSDYFNIATGIETSNQQVYDTVEAEVKTGIKPNYGPPRSGDLFRISLNPAKAKTILGWEPKVDFKSGVKNTVEFYLTKNQSVSVVK